MVYATFSLAHSTNELKKSTDAIREVEVTIKKIEVKQEVMNEINLAEELKNELEFNKVKLKDFIDTLDTYKKTIDIKGDTITTTNLQRANDDLNFADKVRGQLKIYSDLFKLIKDDLALLNTPDQKAKSKNIDSIIGNSKLLYYGQDNIMKIDDLVIEISKYQEQKQNELDELNKNITLDIKNL